MIGRFLLGLVLSCSLPAFAVAEPAASLPFKRAVIREMRWVWGLDAPTAVAAAQINQESRWRPKVCSAYACGLTQFTPATADWIKGAYPSLAGGQVFNPDWAIRALAIYDNHLYKLVKSSVECDRWAMTLAAYNGGLGWINRDVALCRRAQGCDPALWWGNVALHSKRASWAFKENRGYPFKILGNQAQFSTWGRQVACSLPSSPSAARTAGS